jgi:opacity protein-like surface antigen
MFRSRMLKSLIITILVLVFATAAYALAASNTVPSSYAGEGAGGVSGYDVTNLQYNLNGSNASNIDSVTFTLDAAATDVMVRLVTTGSYYSCTNTSGFNWSCDTASPQATVLATDEVRVIARDH